MLSILGRRAAVPAVRRIALKSLSTLPLAKVASAPISRCAVALTVAGLTAGGVLLSQHNLALCEAAEFKESATGIAFPSMCDGLPYCGSGVRVKYWAVKVYAVGIYSGGKTVASLLEPSTDMTIRIVMNRELSVEKYTAAIMEALVPRMGGKDMDKLDDFKKLQPDGQLPNGAEMVSWEKWGEGGGGGGRGLCCIVV